MACFLVVLCAPLSCYRARPRAALFAAAGIVARRGAPAVACVYLSHVTYRSKK